jgi:superfamily II DNA or RNA helicase
MPEQITLGFVASRMTRTKDIPSGPMTVSTDSTIKAPVGGEPPIGTEAARRGEAAIIWTGLRDYQREACEALTRELTKVRSTLVVMATGLGKTITAAKFVHNWKSPHSLWPDSVLWIARGNELLSQARDELERLTGEPVSLEQAQSQGGGTRIMVASVPTLRGDRLARWAKDRFSLIIADEAHHIGAPTWHAIIKHFDKAKVVGLTATPGKHVGKVFESVAIERDIWFGIEEGYLVPMTLEECNVDTIDIGRAKTVMGDLDEATVEEEIVKNVAPIARAVIEATAPGERSLTFTPRVGSAHAVSETLCKHTPENSHCVDGKTDKFLRKSILRDHKANKFQHLLNCLVFTEGYDDPGLSVLTIARITKSRELYVQMLGRGLRALPGIGELPTKELRLAAIKASGKPRVKVVDVTGHAGRHAKFLISPVDILGSRYTEEERKLAKKKLKAKAGDVKEALDEAHEALVKKRRLADLAAAARAASAKVKFRRRIIDPMELLGVTASPGDNLTPADPTQLRWLLERGIDIPPGCTSSMAEKLRRASDARRDAGLGSYKQIRMLRKQGIDATKMRKAMVSDLCQAFFEAWKRKTNPPKERLMEIMGNCREPGEDG